VNDEGKIITVCGPIEPEHLGTCLTHEHILFDFRDVYWVEPEAPELAAIAHSPITLDKRGLLQRNCLLIRENFCQDSVCCAVDEISAYKKAGGDSIVEATPLGQGRDPDGLRRVSEATGVNIIACTGYYIEAGHPGYVSEKSIDELAEVLVRDITEGIDGTDVRAGAMGDVGTTGAVTKNEEKTLRACARAQLATGVLLGIHVDPKAGEGMRVLEVVLNEGVAPHRIQLQHMDEQAEHHLQIAQTGVWMEFDTFGTELYAFGPDSMPKPSDSDRARCIKALVDAGHIDQITVSQDIWLKQLMKRWGGDGYEGLFRYGIPRLKEAGLSDLDIGRMLVDNPRRMLAIAPPHRLPT